MPRRRGVTLVELLVVVGIISVLLALAIPAIQRVRGALDRMRCASNLRQLGIALHHYHNDRRKFPPGVTLPKPDEPMPRVTFLTRLLPYLEKDALWREAERAYAVDPLPFNPSHAAFATPVGLFGCPSDNRLIKSHPTHQNRVAALTSYLGVCGTDWTKKDGVLFADSAVSLDAISDGPSFTLMLGERPPSPDAWFGWWYATVGQFGSGTPDTLLGARELNAGGPYTYYCPPGPASFSPGRLQNQCDAFHFWSLHSGGAHFLMAGGNVHFLAYSADTVLPALATRAGKEPATLDD